MPDDLRSRKSDAAKNPLGLHARYVDGLGRKPPDRSYQSSFVDKIIAELRSGKSVVTSRRYLTRFVARLKEVDPLPHSIVASEKTITIIPKSMSFPPIEVDMVSTARKKPTG